MLSDHLVRPVHIVVYWLLPEPCDLRGASLALSISLASDSRGQLCQQLLVWFRSRCNAWPCTFSSPTSRAQAVAFGLWSAIQILFCGVTVPLDVIPAWALGPLRQPAVLCIFDNAVARAGSRASALVWRVLHAHITSPDTRTLICLLLLAFCARFSSRGSCSHTSWRNVHRVREQSGAMQRRRRIDYGELVHERRQRG